MIYSVLENLLAKYKTESVGYVSNNFKNALFCMRSVFTAQSIGNALDAVPLQSLMEMLPCIGKDKQLYMTFK